MTGAHGNSSAETEPVVQFQFMQATNLTSATSSGISSGGSGGGTAGPRPGGRPPLSSTACPSTTTSCAIAAGASAASRAAILSSAIALQVHLRCCCGECSLSQLHCAQRRPVQIGRMCRANDICAAHVLVTAQIKPYVALCVVRCASVVTVGSAWTSGHLQLRTPRRRERDSLAERCAQVRRERTFLIVMRLD